MSETLLFGTGIKKRSTLEAACQRKRDRGINIEGPIFLRQNNVDICRVRLPNWHQHLEFGLDSSGELTGEMRADNYSDYYDRRAIDPRTGERIMGSGQVHPDVAAGRKRVGDDGRWGDIKELDSLKWECQTVDYELAALAVGGRLASSEVTNDGTNLHLVLEVA